MTFATDDYVEHGGYRLGRIVRGPVRRYGTDDWWLVAPMSRSAGDGTLPDYAQTRQLTPADMTRWLYCRSHNTYHRVYRADQMRCEPCEHYHPVTDPGKTREGCTYCTRCPARWRALPGITGTP
jgi:hypothetical protein